MANTALQKARQALGLSLEQLSDDVGISVSQLSRFETGGRDPRASELLRLGTRLGVPASVLLGGFKVRPIPLVGYAAAGGDGVVFFGDGQGPFDEVAAPAWATDKTVAVKIRGTSLGKQFDGWLAFYDDRRDPPDESLFGELCVCGLHDNRVVIKTLRPGASKGHFHLESLTEPTIFDVRVEWAAMVREMRPK